MFDIIAVICFCVLYDMICIEYVYQVYHDASDALHRLSLSSHVKICLHVTSPSPCPSTFIIMSIVGVIVSDSLSRNCPFERINSLQCYELTRR